MSFKTNGDSLTFAYDPSGNRIMKTYWNDSLQTRKATYHVRDASGNVMATYEHTADTLRLSEWALYGSSRIGVVSPDLQLHPVLPATTDPLLTGINYYSLNEKQYELSNHLGNVQATISDRRMPMYASSVFSHYETEVVSAQDYYPFGSLMPERSFSSEKYRYGFNTQEKVDEISGSGNHTTAEHWEYDTRLGRRWNLDPVVRPWESGYATNRNNSILYKDPNGDDPLTALMEGVTAFGIEAGLDFMTGLIVKRQDASTAFENINWRAAAWEGVKATTMSAFMPTGTQTAARIAKITSSKVGKETLKLTLAFMENITSEAMKNFVSGNYNDDDGNFDYSKLKADFENLAYTAGITTLLDAGMGGKAQELYKKLEKSNSKLAKQYEKLFKNLDSQGSTQKTIESRVKKVNAAAKELGKDAAKATGAKVAEESVKKAGDEGQKKVRGVN